MIKLSPVWAGALVSAILGLQCWTLLEVVNLKVGLATVTAKLEAHTERSGDAKPQLAQQNLTP